MVVEMLVEAVLGRIFRCAAFVSRIRIRPRIDFANVQRHVAIPDFGNERHWLHLGFETLLTGDTVPLAAASIVSHAAVLLAPECPSVVHIAVDARLKRLDLASFRFYTDVANDRSRCRASCAIYQPHLFRISPKVPAPSRGSARHNGENECVRAIQKPG